MFEELAIERNGDIEESCEARICLVISHQNRQDLPAGSVLKLQIDGITNPESAREGSFEVYTQLLVAPEPQLLLSSESATESREAYKIDQGTVVATFVAEEGVASDAKITPSSTETRAENVEYTFEFTLDIYVPALGQFTFEMPQADNDY